MRKRYTVAAVIGTVAVAVFFSWLYHKTGKAWLLAFTGVACGGCIWLLLRAVFASRNGMQTASPQNTYRKKSRYISPAEYDFLLVLRSILGANYEVCAQAPLVAVIEKTSGGAFRNELFRVADYAVIDRVTAEPLLLIELNDASHNRADRQERDRKVAAICAEADLPLLAFTVQEAKDVSEVRKKIYGVLRRYK